MRREFQAKEKAGVVERSRSIQTSATRESIALYVPQTPLEPETKKSISMTRINPSRSPLRWPAPKKLQPAANSAVDGTSKPEPQRGVRPMHGHIASSAAAEIVPVVLNSAVQQLTANA